MELGFGDELRTIINRYKDGIDEALDGDAVDDLTEILRAQMNLMEGNITEEEYLEMNL